jgi:PAS domain S-box-containing protein
VKLLESLGRLREENLLLRAALDETDAGKALLRREAEFSRLLEASKAIIADLDSATVLPLVAESAREIVDAELVSIPMLDEDREGYTYVAASGVDAELVRGTRFKSDVGMCGWVLRNERSLLFGESSPFWMAEKPPWEAGQQSAVLVPLFGRRGIIGGLSAHGKVGGGAFTRHDLDLLTMFANLASSAIENALLFQEHIRYEEGLKSVNECFLSFGSDPLKNLRKITRTTGKVLRATAALYNRKDGDSLRTMAGWQTPADMPLSDTGRGHLCFDVIARGGDAPLVVRRLQASPYAETDPNVRKYGLELYVGFPVRSGDQATIGSLCAVFREDADISPYQLTLLGLLGRAAGVEEERLRSGEALRASETRFRTIIENSSVGIVAAEIGTGRFLYVNPVLCRMLGYTRDELLALSIRSIHPEEELPLIEKTFSRHEDVQTRCRRRDGSQFDVDIKAVMTELDGTPCLIGFFTDITDRRLLDEERYKAQKLEAIGTLAGGIAHDFNNLLQAIYGYIHMAKAKMPPASEACAMLVQAERSLQQSVSLTNQLLTFSKGGKPVKKRVDLKSVVENSTRFVLSGSRSDFRLDIPPDLWTAEADEGQLAQVVQNIVLNADQAMGGAGLVHVCARNVPGGDPSLPQDLASSDHVAISVRDTGCGIARSDIGRIFDPYFTTKPKGSGLGLATSWSIVRNHGGEIEVESRPGEGSTFRIWLPASPVAPPASSTQPVLSETVGRASLRVLVMDDEEALRTLSRHMLKALGHDAELASDGREALERYRAAMSEGKPYDVVILDLTVRGGMGGEEAMRHLLEIDPSVKAVVSSGYSNDATMSDFRSKGFRACLMKPFDLDRLGATLAAVSG